MPTYGQNTDVDNSAERLVASTIPVRFGTYIKALAANSSNIVYVGLSDQVAATTGWPLGAGEELFVSKEECADATDIWVIGSTSNLAVAYRAV